MRRIILFLLIPAIFNSCGSNEKKESNTVSAEMKAFMKKLDGKSASVTAALKEFGKDGLDDVDMDLYDLKDATVVEAKDSCYLMSAKSGITVRKYFLCWEAGKISSVEDRGME